MNRKINDHSDYSNNAVHRFTSEIWSRTSNVECRKRPKYRSSSTSPHASLMCAKKWLRASIQNKDRMAVITSDWHYQLRWRLRKSCVRTYSTSFAIHGWNEAKESSVEQAEYRCCSNIQFGYCARVRQRRMTTRMKIQSDGVFSEIREEERKGLDEFMFQFLQPARWMY